jgi:crotonobetainyl-CoA:carnitine CoA-transferase CaiB-like acyl-CoA transferase
MDRTGYVDGEPMRLGHALPDGIGGVVGALAALRGLREREERGHGGWFDLSQLESYAAMSGEDVLASWMGGRLPPAGFVLTSRFDMPTRSPQRTVPIDSTTE